MRPARIAADNPNPRARLPVLNTGDLRRILNPPNGAVFQPFAHEGANMVEGDTRLHEGSRDYDGFAATDGKRPPVQGRGRDACQQYRLAVSSPHRKRRRLDARAEGPAKETPLPRQDRKRLTRPPALSDGQPSKVGFKGGGHFSVFKSVVCCGVR